MVRLSAKHRKYQILHKVIELAQTQGLYTVTVARVAEALGIGHSLILYHFKSAIKMRNEALRLCIDEQVCHEVIAQAILARDPIVSNFGPDEKKIYLESIV